MDAGYSATYVAGLKRSLTDKLWFLSKLPPDVTVFADFGCADGEVLRAISVELGGEGTRTIHCLGYDHSEDMVQRARLRRVPSDEFLFTASYERFAMEIAKHRLAGRKVCLILSSVVHEVLSKQPGFAAFWHQVRRLECDYVAIRDMAVGQVSRDSLVHPHELEATRHLPGMPRTYLGLSRAAWLEALLKARYPENFESESQESYFPLTSEQWLNYTTIASGYQLRHFDHSALPYLRAAWACELGLHIPDPTHIKLLLQKG